MGTWRQSKAQASGRGLRTGACGAGAALLLLGAPPEAEAGEIFWADWNLGNGTGQIRTVNFDGTGAQTILGDLPRPIGVALDVANQHVYIGDGGFAGTPGSIRRVDFDGSNPVTLLDLATHGDDAQHLRLDLAGGKVYWASYHNGLRRANLDGTNVELVEAGDGPGGVSSRGHLAIHGGSLYAGSPETNNVAQSPLTAPGVFTDVPVDTVGANDMALNVPGTRLYWANIGGSIQSDNFPAGGDLQTLVTGLGTPLGVALSADESLIYWTERGGQRIAFDDTDPNTPSNARLIIAAGNPFGIAVVPEPGAAGVMLLAAGTLFLRRRRAES